MAGQDSRPMAILRMPWEQRLPFLDFAAAINDEGYVLAVLRRLHGSAFGGGFDVADLRIAGRLQLGHKLLLGKGMSW